MYFLADSVVHSIPTQASQTISWVLWVLLLTISRHCGLRLTLPIAHGESLLALQTAVGLDVGCIAVERKHSAEAIDGDKVA